MSKERYDRESIIEKLKDDLSSTYQLALHQIGIFGTPESKWLARQNNFFARFRSLKEEDFCKSIMKSGLKNRYENLMFTVMGFGSIDEIDNSEERKKEFLTYDYNKIGDPNYIPSDNVYEVVLAIPSHIRIDGKEYFIGYLEHGSDEKRSIRNKESEKLFDCKPVPKEFIYGYIHRQNNQEYTLVCNKHHVSKMEPDKQEEFYKNFIEKREIDLTRMEAVKDTNNRFGEQLNGMVEEITENDLEEHTQPKNIEDINIER